MKTTYPATNEELLRDLQDLDVSRIIVSFDGPLVGDFVLDRPYCVWSGKEIRFFSSEEEWDRGFTQVG